MDVTQQKATISECYNTGAIAETGSSPRLRMGGILGVCIGSGELGKISNCYSAGKLSRTTTSADRYSGAIAGRFDTSIAYELSDCVSQSFGANTTYAFYLQNRSGIYSSKDGILASSSSLIGMSKSIGSHFVEDTTNLNNGLPVLSWEQSHKRIY